MGKLTNKVAVVTGASKGIGAGIAKGLAADGASVVVNYASSKEGADKVVAEIKAKGGKAVAADWELSPVHAMRRHQGLPAGECGDTVAPYEGIGDRRTGPGDARGEVCELCAAARCAEGVYGAVG